MKQENPEIPAKHSLFDHGKVRIESKFEWYQEVWFVHDGIVKNGEVVGIKAEAHIKWTLQPPMLTVEHKPMTSVNVPQHTETITIREDYCYESREDLKAFLFA